MWPTIENPDDVGPAFGRLPAIVERLLELRREHLEASPVPLGHLFHELWGATSVDLEDISMRLGMMARYPQLQAVVEPVALGDNVAAAYWQNRNGLTELRRQRRTTGASRGQLRALARHVDDVLFPALQADWTRLGARVDKVVPIAEHAETIAADFVARHMPGKTAPTKTSTLKGAPSWH